MRAERRERVRRATGRVAAVLLPAIVIGVIAAYTAVGWLRRAHEAATHAEPLLFSRELAEHLPLAALVFVVAAAVCAGVVIALRWVARAALASGSGGAPGTLGAAVAWVYARWWRLALVLAVVWAPLLALRWPGAVNPDFALMVTEIAKTRSEFAPGEARPFDVYPIAYSLIPDGELVWSNQHNAFLTLVYGGVAALSGVLFHSYVPGIVLLSGTQALFTLFALGRALQLVGRGVARPGMKAAALALTAAGAMIALWSMDLSKNPLFAAAFVWWLALVIDRALLSRRRWWVAETLVATTVMILSVKFGLYVALAGALLLLLHRAGWRAVALGVLVPVAVLQVALRGLIGVGVVIPDDPTEARVTQLQQVALIAREDPAALTPERRAVIERVFDLDAMVAAYVPETADPVKSSGFEDNGSYRWRTVQPQDWDGFTGVWLQLAAERPDLFVDAFLLKSDKYLDPAADTYPWPPLRTWDWTVSYSLDLSGVNPGGRSALEAGLAAAYASPARYLISPSAWAVLTLLLCAVAVSLRRPGAMTWSLLLALQIGVALLAPLNGSGRYLLGVIYAAGVVFLALGLRPTRPAADDADAGSTALP